MTSRYLLESLHRQTATGEAVGVAESYRGGAIRLVYRRRRDGVITRWRVESAELLAPAEFRTEAEGRKFIRYRWAIDTRKQGLP